MILLPLYWQEIRHESVVDTGLLTAPQGLGMALVMPLAGQADRPLRRRAARARSASIVTTLATIPFGLIGAHTSIFGLSVAMFVRGMGIGFAFMPAMAAAFASLRALGARRRHAAAQRPAARRRLDRHRGARGRAPARAGRRAHARRRRAGVRHGLLGGRRAHRAGDRAVHHPAARRAGRAGGQGRQRQSAARRRWPRRWRHDAPHRHGRMRASRRSPARPLVQGRDGGGATAARARDAPARRAQLRPVQPALRPRARAGSCPSASSRWPPTSRRPPSRRCSTASRRPASSSACARSATGASC